MLQGGQVFIGDQTIDSNGNPWNFRAAVTVGVHDLVAVGPSAAVIRHDQPILMPYVEPTIDQAQGLDLGTLAIEDEFCDGFIDLETDLLTVNGTHVVLSIDTQFSDSALYFPSELLEPGDTQVVVAVEPNNVFGDEDGRYSAGAFIDPNTPNVPLFVPIEPPIGATFGSDDVSVDFVGASIDSSITEYRVEYSTQAAPSRRPRRRAGSRHTSARSHSIRRSPIFAGRSARRPSTRSRSWRVAPSTASRPRPRSSIRDHMQSTVPTTFDAPT